jgi:cytidyltransferase-like protein
VDTYADKIEIYDPSAGSFFLQGGKYQGAHYHHVSVDLQLHVLNDDSAETEATGSTVLITAGNILAGYSVQIHHSDFDTRGQAALHMYEPFGSIDFAGRSWPVPAQQKVFLSYLYGYLGHGAEFDQNAKLYRKPLVAAVDVNTGDASDKTQPLPRPLRLYTDMCADLFHSGHVNYLRQCCTVADNVHLIVGIHSDATIESYKRASVCTMEERIGVVEACRFVDAVLPHAPLRVTEEFMDQNDIDFVVHGTETPELERQAMYDIPIGRGMYIEVPRTPGISTTELIDRIASRLAVDYKDHALPSGRKPAATVVKEMENQHERQKNK